MIEREYLSLRKGRGDAVEKIKWERAAAILICVALGTAALIFGLRYLLPILLPFLIAWGISALIRPAARRLGARFGIPVRLLSAALLILLLGGVILLSVASVKRLIYELQDLLTRVLLPVDGTTDAASRAIDYLEGVISQNPIFQRLVGTQRTPSLHERLNDALEQALSGVVRSLSESLPALLGKLLSLLPSAVLITAVTVIASFYFCMDGEKITGALCACLPIPIRRRLPLWRASARRLSWRYLRAYLLLLLATFSALFLGFCVLRVKYAFLLALTVAVVDLLPILGVGTVLIPWAIVCFLQRNYFLGIGLLILYAVTLILRQILEPRLVGKSLGLSPILTLFSTYAGYVLLGFLGMIVGPIVALSVKNLVVQLEKRY